MNDPRRQRSQGNQSRGDSAVVMLESGAPIDGALKRFGRQVQRAGIIRELRRRETFTPAGRAPTVEIPAREEARREERRPSAIGPGWPRAAERDS